jgi:hypothetical protein
MGWVITEDVGTVLAEAGGFLRARTAENTVLLSVAAISRAALDACAHEVVLFTDLDNPTSNALYRRIGYQPVSDRSVLSFTSPAPDPAPS